MVDENHVTHFIAFGYVPLRGLFSRGEAAALREEFDRLLREDYPDFDGSQPRQVAHVCERGERHAALIGDERLLDVPRKILGHDFIYEGSAAAAHVGDTPWHGGSGVITWGLPHVKISLYLDDLTARNGCLRVVPGAHRNYLRLVDPRWAQAPDYYVPLRNRNTRDDFRPWGLRPQEVPHVPLESSLGDVLVFTEDLPHAAFGVSGVRRQLAISFVANPVDDEQRRWLKQRQACSDGELRPPRSFIDSDDPRKRKMVQPLVDLGFEPRD